MFTDGYGQGYRWVAYEGGSAIRYRVIQELRQRGASPRTQWGVGFMKGVQDAAKGLPKRY